LCVVGEPGFAELIHSNVENLKVKGRRVEARSIAADSVAATCHVVYLGPEADVELAIRALGTAPVLTVASRPDFWRQGGMINLIRSERSMGFEINLEASRSVGLELSARLLDVALRVEKP